jgi:hypothetical protein
MSPRLLFLLTRHTLVTERDRTDARLAGTRMHEAA